MSEQRADPTLKELFQSVLPPGEVGNYAQGYVIQDDIIAQVRMAKGVLTIRCARLSCQQHFAKEF